MEFYTSIPLTYWCILYFNQRISLLDIYFYYGRVQLSFQLPLNQHCNCENSTTPSISSIDRCCRWNDFWNFFYCSTLFNIVVIEVKFKFIQKKREIYIYFSFFFCRWWALGPQYTEDQYRLQDKVVIITGCRHVYSAYFCVINVFFYVCI